MSSTYPLRDVYIRGLRAHGLGAQNRTRAMTFRNAIFAGGGSRCFWQLGFFEGAIHGGLDLRTSVEFTGSTSAGCAIASAAVLDRSSDALDIFKALCADNPRNIHWHNLSPFKRGSLLPHDRMYREALRSMIGPEELGVLKETSLHFLLSAYPKWLDSPLAVALGFSIYVLESTLRNPLHPKWPSKAGFRPLVARAADCGTPEDLIDIILAASCVPPVLPGGRLGKQRVLDGGLIENIPVRLADDQPGETLVLLSRKYDDPLPSSEGTTWVQPSRPIKIDKFDYANPDGLQETFDLGFEDGRRFARG